MFGTGSDLSITGLEITEGGATITDNTTLNGNITPTGDTSGGYNIQLPDNVPTSGGNDGNVGVVETPQVTDQVINEDADLYQDYGIPIQDVSSNQN